VHAKSQSFIPALASVHGTRGAQTSGSTGSGWQAGVVWSWGHAARSVSNRQYNFFMYPARIINQANYNLQGKKLNFDSETRYLYGQITENGVECKALLRIRRHNHISSPSPNLHATPSRVISSRNFKNRASLRTSVKML
jgi:hypothetical protein